MSGPPPMDPGRNRFLYPAQMNAIAKFVSRLGMVQDVEILRRTPDENPASAANVYGDDALEFVETGDSRRHWVKGWIYSTPTPVQSVDTGAIVTVNTYVFRCPVGTDILPGDELAIDGVGMFTVSDTTTESTWKVLINCSLRLRE